MYKYNRHTYALSVRHDTCVMIHLVKCWIGAKLNVANLVFEYILHMNLMYSYVVISLLMHFIIACLVIT